MSRENLESPYDGLSEISDTNKRRQLLFRVLSEHSDPKWKEIGYLLRDNEASIRDVFADEDFRSFIMENFEKNKDAFEGRITEALEDLEEGSNGKED